MASRTRRMSVDAYCAARGAAFGRRWPLQRARSAEWLALMRIGRSLEAADQAVNVTQDPEIPDQVTLEREDGSPIPPDVTAGRLDVEQRASMKAMETELPEDLVPLFCESEDIGRVVVEGLGNELHVADELRVPDQLRPQRAAECEIGVEDLRYQRNVRVVP